MISLRARHTVRPPGLHRLAGSPEVWVDETGSAVTDTNILNRLRVLHVPPAWIHVWASTNAESPLQATGVDARGRTQYRYSVAASESASQNKFDHILQFAAALPALRTHVDSDLNPVFNDPARLPTGRRVSAAIIRLLDRGLFRIGNDRYARENHTYGLTTLTRGQVKLHNDAASFDFIGKEHVSQHIVVEDAPTVAVLRELMSQDGDQSAPLFATAEPPSWRHIDSVTVNSYIHTAGGLAASAKAFRTWGATVIAASITAGATLPAATSTRRTTEWHPYDAAALLLGNTPSVARRSYVHPGAVTAGHSPGVLTAVERATATNQSADVRKIFTDPLVQAAVHAALSDTNYSLGTVG